MATVTRAQKLRLGIFVGTALFALGFGLVMLVGPAMLQERDDYLIRFSSSGVSFSGLEVGSPVKYSGIAIGQVRAIRIAPDDVSVVEVEVSVERGTPIAEDSVATLAVLGITGLKYVELSRGSSHARIRSPGEEILAGDSLFDELSQRAGVIAERIEDLIISIQSMLDEDTKTHVQRLLGASAGILEDNRPHISDILANVRSLTADLARISESGVSVAAKTDLFMDRLGEVGESLHSLLSAEGQLIGTMQQAERLVERMNMIVLRSESDLDVAMRHLRDATANLNDFSLTIRDDPRALLSSPDHSRSDERRGESRRGGGR